MDSLSGIHTTQDAFTEPDFDKVLSIALALQMEIRI
jgi:hypothetical protein